jgi:hypothetical protein
LNLQSQSCHRRLQLIDALLHFIRDYSPVRHPSSLFDLVLQWLAGSQWPLNLNAKHTLPVTLHTFNRA